MLVEGQLAGKCQKARSFNVITLSEASRISLCGTLQNKLDLKVLHCTLVSWKPWSGVKWTPCKLLLPEARRTHLTQGLQQGQANRLCARTAAVFGPQRGPRAYVASSDLHRHVGVSLIHHPGRAEHQVIQTAI